MTPPPVVAVTGAGGFVGRHLCDRFHARGWRVRALVRDPAAFERRDSGIETFSCELPDRIDERAFTDASVVIHAAYATRPTTLEAARRVNELGTARVLAVARSAGARRFVFLSSTSADEHSPTYYGRSKFVLERTLDPGRDLIVRAGLVLGPDGGLFQRLVATIRRLPVVPLVDRGDRIVQTVHVDDLCLAVERAIERDVTGRIVVAEPDGIALLELLRSIAERLGKRRVFLRLPVGPLAWLVSVFERVGVKLPVSSDNLRAVRALRVQPSAPDLERLGIRPRTARQSLDELLG